MKTYFKYFLSSLILRIFKWKNLKITLNGQTGTKDFNLNWFWAYCQYIVRLSKPHTLYFSSILFPTVYLCKTILSNRMYVFWHNLEILTQILYLALKIEYTSIFEITNIEYLRVLSMQAGGKGPKYRICTKGRHMHT